MKTQALDIVGGIIPQYVSIDNMFINLYGDWPASRNLVKWYNTGHSTGYATLKMIINMYYADKWKRLYQLLVTDYNPIENYNMTEDHGDTVDRNKAVSMTSTSDISDTSGVFPFNSMQSSPVSSGRANDTTRSYGSADENTEHEQHTGNVSRSGNIGVTTTQQMIEQELEVRKNTVASIIIRDMLHIMGRGVI